MKGRPRALPDFKCKMCGRSFRPKDAKKLFCSRECYRQHPDRLKTHGLDDTIWRKVNRTATCWLWTGAKQKRTGYGCCFYLGKNTLSHIAVYMILVGPVPEGKELDHKCRVRNCCNPDHLEPVTHLENLKRSPFNRKIACKRGHVFDKRNTYIDKAGHRFCRQCARTKGKESYQKNKEKILAKTRERYKFLHN